MLFSIGSGCFALGALPGYASWVRAGPDAVTFFVGSIFFTSAGYLQLTGADADPVDPPRARPVAWKPGSPSAWAALIQLVGTVWFNVSTFHAIDLSLSASQQDQMIWRPDAEGSICFLVASTIVLMVASRRDGWRARGKDWRAAALNMAGSVAFGASAFAAYVVPASGEVRNAELVNLGTFVGALCFLSAALLALPRDDRRG